MCSEGGLEHAVSDCAGGRSRSPRLGPLGFTRTLTSSFSGLFLDSTSTCREMVSPMLFLLDKRSSSGEEEAGSWGSRPWEREPESHPQFHLPGPVPLPGPQSSEGSAHMEAIAGVDGRLRAFTTHPRVVPSALEG